MNLVRVFFAIIFVFFLSFLATEKAKSMTNDLMGKYDDTVNCHVLSKLYQGNTLSQLAADEWIQNYIEDGGFTAERKIGATLTCFCTA